MGWELEEAPGHEGYVALMFADGERHSGTTGNGVLVWPGGDIKREEIRPYADVVAWQAHCECGWTGVLRPLSAERPEDMYERWREPTGEREEDFRLEWRAHVAPEVRTSRVTDLAAQIAGLQRDLTVAVAEARREGASWSDLGRALGVSKQAAQQRYGS